MEDSDFDVREAECKYLSRLGLAVIVKEPEFGE